MTARSHREEEALRRAVEARALAERDLAFERSERDAAERRADAAYAHTPWPRRGLASVAGGGLWALAARKAHRALRRPWAARDYGRYIDPGSIADSRRRALVEAEVLTRRRAEASWRFERAARARADWRVRALDGGVAELRGAAVRALAEIRMARWFEELVGIAKDPLRIQRARDGSATVSAFVIASPRRAPQAVRALRRVLPATSEVWYVTGPIHSERQEASFATALRRACGENIVIWAPSTPGETPRSVPAVLAMLESDLGLAAVAGQGSWVTLDWRAASPVAIAAESPDGNDPVPPGASGTALALRRGIAEPGQLVRGGFEPGWVIERTVELSLSGHSIGACVGGASNVTPLPAELPRLRAQLGARARARILNDLVDGGGRWCNRPLSLFSSDPALRAAAGRIGWRVVDSPGDADASVEASPAIAGLEVDWLLQGERLPALVPWPNGNAERALADALRSALGVPSIVMRIGARDLTSGKRGGDYHLARALAGSLSRRGHLVLIEARSEGGAGQCMDVAVNIRGRVRRAVAAGQLNLLWLISHPEEVTSPELESHDAVLVASRPYAAYLARSLSVPVHELLQFTDPAIFQPLPSAEHRHEIAFVGNWRSVLRPIVWDALRAGYRPALYGAGWREFAPAHTIAEHIDHSQLPQVYSSCTVLLVDHWDDMRRNGFISNRVFDALACGSSVITDDHRAIAEEFGDRVQTYRYREDLARKIAHHLDDVSARRRRVEGARDIVLSEHTADRRAEEVREILRALPRGSARSRLAHRAGKDGGPRTDDHVQLSPQDWETATLSCRSSRPTHP